MCHEGNRSQMYPNPFQGFVYNCRTGFRVPAKVISCFARHRAPKLRRSCPPPAACAYVSCRSFVEKCVRKWSSYPDPVEQFTDLCGARGIVHTSEQVQAVR